MTYLFLFAMIVMTLTNLRFTTDEIAVHGSNYDYAPVVVADSRTTPSKLYACASETGRSGDYIVRWTASRFTTTHAGRQIQLAPNRGYLDGVHVCDPSVVQATSGPHAGLWFMYYGGSPYTKNTCNGCAGLTFVFVAWSKTGGPPWYRTNGYQPIVHPRGVRDPGGYGAGQPSVFFRPADQKFYMLYTDTTGFHAGMYVARSSDYLFQAGVEEYQQATNTWMPLNGMSDMMRTTGAFSPFPNGYSQDWAYTSTNQVVVAIADAVHGGRFANVWSAPLDDMRQGTWSATVHYDPAGSWTRELRCKQPAQSLDGPGLVRRPNGQLYADNEIDLFTGYWCLGSFLTAELFWSGGTIQPPTSYTWPQQKRPVG